MNGNGLVNVVVVFPRRSPQVANIMLHIFYHASNLKFLQRLACQQHT